MRTVSIKNHSSSQTSGQLYIIKINIIINMETEKLQFHYCIPKKK